MKRQDNVLMSIIPDIERHDWQQIKRKSQNETFELRAYHFLMSNLVGGIGGLFIRALLCELGINEHYIFRWRMENKFIQYLVLNHYNHGSMPLSISLSDQLEEITGVQGVRNLFKEGFFLKATLSERTGITNTFDRTAEFEDIIKILDKKHSPHNEKWILQKRMNIKNEFRIHTFNKEIIFGLTFLISGNDLPFKKPESFLESILKNLPDALLQGSLIAWDIALTVNDQYYIIESNFTGFHPEFKYGYQTSGYFQDHVYGPIICAWFNNYIKIRYNLCIDSIEYSLYTGTSFYRKFMYYTSLFKEKHIEALLNTKENTRLTAIIYMGAPNNIPIINLLIHFDKVQFANTYYVIISTNDISTVKTIFHGKPHINFIVENELFLDDQFSLIQQLNHERRKQISCLHALRRSKDKNCIIV